MVWTETEIRVVLARLCVGLHNCGRPPQEIAQLVNRLGGLARAEIIIREHARWLCNQGNSELAAIAQRLLMGQQSQQIAAQLYMGRRMFDSRVSRLCRMLAARLNEAQRATPAGHAIIRRINTRRWRRGQGRPHVLAGGVQ